MKRIKKGRGRGMMEKNERGQNGGTQVEKKTKKWEQERKKGKIEIGRNRVEGTRGKRKKGKIVEKRQREEKGQKKKGTRVKTTERMRKMFPKKPVFWKK